MSKGKDEGNGIGMRHVQALMATTAIMVTYVFRVIMSVAIVVMTNKANANPNFPEYKWSEAEKSLILSSFFWGYPILQILIGKLAEKYGSKIILAVAMILCSLLTIVIPFVAPYGYLPVLIVRVLQGASQGSFIPCVTVLLSKWFSPVERSRAAAIAISGGKLGTVIAFPVSGYLASSTAGWPAIFYVTGSIGLVWVLIWLWLGASTPYTCRNISEKEKLYIETSVKNDNQIIKKPRTPWKDIIKSKPLWAILITHAGHNWGYWLLLTQLPNYMNSVLSVNIKKNGLLSALPYLSAWSATLLYSWIAVYVSTHYSMSKTVLRKIFNSIGLWGCGLGFLVLALWNTVNVTVVTCILITTISLNAAIYLGFMTNHLDLSPNFCGTLMGITNSISNIASLFAPLTVGWMVDDATSQLAWKNVFFLSFGIMFTSNLFYLIFGSSEVQSWNNPRTPIVKNYGIRNEKSVVTKEHERQLL